MNELATALFHVRNGTPLRQLANSVRWFEERAKLAEAGERNAFKQKAKAMRRIVSAVYAHRIIHDQYDMAA